VTLVDTWARNPAAALATYVGLEVKDIPTATQEKITAVLYDLFKTLNQYCMQVESRTGAAALNNLFTTAGRHATAAQWDKAGVNVFDSADLVADNTIYPFAAPASDAERLSNMRTAEASITALFYQFANVVSSVLSAADGLEAAFEASLLDQYPTYANVARGVGNSLQTVPPSGAVAGVFSSVDRTRGVWKAPANVSLNSVTDITYLIDNDEQSSLNVDTTAGKSINAIRPFTGRGILVWGARTLAGNDNEWRYVSVRRFFIMVEESLKKSTLWAVFEPNDANLWMKIKSMIENYLIQKWRDGALAGAKPDHAFFVNVGLGSTMTAQDILEGRLIVEIGLAVVRPAEFIILRFSHKMQQS
jgi:phage tail sheath protein FI